jgi:hypothetical protein
MCVLDHFRTYSQRYRTCVYLGPELRRWRLDQIGVSVETFFV